MRRLSIARFLSLALLGLTLALAAVAALAVGSLYAARQDYEEEIAQSYAAEVAAADILAAGVVEEAVLRSQRGGAASRRQAARTFEAAADGARQMTGDDPRSKLLLERVFAAEQRVRETARSALRPGPAAARQRNRALDLVGEQLREGRVAAAQLAARQATRRSEARERATSRTRRAFVLALVAGALALVAALALVSLLVAGLRRPMTSLIGATRRLAGGELQTRVKPDGPAEFQELATAFNAMAEDLEIAQGRVEDSRRRLATAIESLGDALIVSDSAGRVVQVNPRAGELVPDLVVGASVLAPTSPLPPFEEALGAESEIDHRGRTLAVTAARMGPRPEDGVVFTVRDSTERARLERAKSDFVATASHELRSPLTSIKGFVELLSATDLAHRQREFVDIIALSTQRLVDLVNDLLDVARVEAGQLEIQRRPIAVAEAVHEVVALMRPRFDARSQELELDIAPALPVALADPARVRQIVTNLLTNAHLYTPEHGRIAVAVGAAGEHVLLSVADSGRGMTEEQIERAFDRFYRGDGQATTGTGLGLSIVRSLVELHGGRVDVESEVGRGTTVTVRLPRAPVSDEALGPREALRGRRVLVVEDEPDVAQLIETQLAPFEVEVTVATSGDEALELLRHDHFDAVTLDILLGGMTGFEVLRAMRDDPLLRLTPVIVVSVMAGRDALAAEWSVSKPIDADELTEAIGAAILAGRGRVLVVGRPALQAEVGPMLRRRGIDFEWAVNGAEAGRLCEERHFEVALVDAGMRAPQAALAQLDLRGRRLRRSVVVFSTGDDAPGLARLDPTPVPVEDATQAVLDALRSGAGVETGPLADPVHGPGVPADAVLTDDRIDPDELRRRLARKEAEVEALRAELDRHERDAASRSSQLQRYAADLREIFKQERTRAQELKRSYRATVRALANAVEARDAYTGRHAERVAAYGLEIATAAGIDLADSPEMEFGFLLHDVGKVAVPDAILFKTTRLTEEEYALIRQHPATGWEILREIDFLGEAKLVVRHHHERWDGAGYPDGLTGDEIPFAARVFSVADTLDALTTDRPYRPASPFSKAREVIASATGAQFDPEVVAAYDAVPDSRFAELRERLG